LVLPNPEYEVAERGSEGSFDLKVCNGLLRTGILRSCIANHNLHQRSHLKALKEIYHYLPTQNGLHQAYNSKKHI